MRNHTIFVLLGLLLVTLSCNDTKNDSNLIIESTPEKEQVLQAVLRFHNGMRSKDGSLAISGWAKTAAGYSISIDSLGNVTKSVDDPVDELKLERIKNWLNETDDYLDEEVFDVEVRIDGELAIAWVPYNFYRNNKFSHSGTNAFTLMKFDNLWKIVSVADTRYYGKKIHD